MQQNGEFGRYYEDGRSSRTNRPASGTRRHPGTSRAARPGDVPGRVGAGGSPGGGAAALRRDIRRSLSTQSAIRRVMLLREILGPPRAMQPLDSDPHGSQDNPPHGSQDREPQRASVKTKNGHAQNGASSAHLTEDVARPALRAAAPAAQAEPQAAAPPGVRPGEPAAPPEPSRAAPPHASPQGGAAAGVLDALDASVSALRRFLRRVGIGREPHPATRH